MKKSIHKTDSTLMKNFSLYLLAVLFSIPAFSQKAWIKPDDFNPADSVTIYIDIAKCDCQTLLNYTEDLYLWTWKPKEHPVGHPLHNGTWLESNEALKLKQESANVYSFRMVPTAFYEATASEIYANDFSFLVKAKDGGSGGGCAENKTEDLFIAIDPPKSGPVKVACFPSKLDKDTLSISPDDVFTLIYNQKLEEKTSMQTVSDLYVFIQAVTNAGTTISYEPITKTGNFAELALSPLGNQIYHFPIIPTELFDSKIPTGQSIIGIKCQIVRQKISSSDDAVDGTFSFWFNTNCP